MERKTLIVSRNEISEELKRSTKTRWITAGIAIFSVIPVIFLGEWPMLIFILFVLGVAVWEMLHVTGQKYRVDVYVFMYIFAYCLTLWPIARGVISWLLSDRSLPWTIYFKFDAIYLSVIVLTIMLFTFFFIVVMHEYLSVRDACFFFTMIVFISLGLQGILDIRFVPQYIFKYIAMNDFAYFSPYNLFGSTTLLIYCCLACFLNDAGAYFTGIYFGKHKMNPRISPKKTWEGFVGGILTATLVSFAFGMILAAFGHPLLPFVPAEPSFSSIAPISKASMLDLNHWYNILILSIALPLLATLGDFVFSSIKRYYEIKDFGHIMPGHGGILDRLDSLIFVFAGASLFVAIFANVSQGINFFI